MFKVMTVCAHPCASMCMCVFVRVFNALDRKMITVLTHVIISSAARFNPFPDIFPAKGISPPIPSD